MPPMPPPLPLPSPGKGIGMGRPKSALKWHERMRRAKAEAKWVRRNEDIVRLLRSINFWRYES